jgi:hypothetical protein
MQLGSFGLKRKIKCIYFHSNQIQTRPQLQTILRLVNAHQSALSIFESLKFCALACVRGCCYSPPLAWCPFSESLMTQTYNSKVLIGNWSEDLELKEVC